MNRRLFTQRSRSQAFTLLELLLVITIIGIITSLIVVRIQASKTRAQEESCRHNRSELNSAIERFNVDTGAYPTTLGDLNTTDYFPGGIPVCPLTENAYTLNTTTNRVEGHSNSGNH